MAKHSQTIRRQFANKLFECVWPFCVVGVLRVNYDIFLCIGQSLFYVNMILISQYFR